MDAAQLDAIPLFAGMTLDQRASVAEVCGELDVEEGATLVKEGDFGFAAFAITSGTADVVRDGEVVRTLGSGDVFGEIAVLSGGRAPDRDGGGDEPDVARHRAQSRHVAPGARAPRHRCGAARDDRRAARPSVRP